MMAANRKRVGACLKNLVTDFFDYETPVILRTKAKRVGIIYRVIQTATLTFFFMYSIVYLKGYQFISDSEASVILTRVKGEPFGRFAHLVYDEKFLHYCKLETESNNPEDPMAYFHGGNDISIPVDFEWMPQKQTKCPEDPMVPGARCDPNNNKCARNKSLPMGNGRMTGKCVPAIITNHTVCEVLAWCPVISSKTPTVDVPQSYSADSAEGSKTNTTINDQVSTGNHDGPNNSGSDEESTSDQSKDPDPIADENTVGIEAILDIAQDAENDIHGPNATENGDNGIAGLYYQFTRMEMWTSIRNVTIVIKNPVEFLDFQESRLNYKLSAIPCWRDTNYDTTHSCPIFSVEDILEEVAGKIDNVSAKDLMKTGGVISCVVKWKCDFDTLDKDKSCDIEYVFTRVDQPRSGVGQRTMFLSDHEGERVAVRVSFIRFIFKDDVSAGKFDAIQLLFKLGALFGIFSIATLFCEYIFLNTDWLVKRTVVEMKYLEPDRKHRTRSLVLVQSRNDQENDETSN